MRGGRLERTIASVSPKPARRSEWPTITAEQPGVLEHFGRNLARIGAACLPVAVLAAELDWRSCQDAL